MWILMLVFSIILGVKGFTGEQNLTSRFSCVMSGAFFAQFLISILN